MKAKEYDSLLAEGLITVDQCEAFKFVDEALSEGWWLVSREASRELIAKNINRQNRRLDKLLGSLGRVGISWDNEQRNLG